MNAVEGSPETFGIALRRLRQRVGLTQERLAERAGLSANAVSALERGERKRPYSHTVHALGAALRLTSEERDTLLSLSRPATPPGRPAAGTLESESESESEAGAGAGAGTATSDAAPGRSGVPRALPIPRQLPTAIRDFTGRGSDLARLDTLLPATGAADRRESPSVVISAIGGTAGVGKTALAVMWAHRIRDRFPDGQLYVNLRGYDPGPPVTPGEALDGFLRALDVPIEKIPPAIEQRAALFRSVLDGRRVLVVLDNANTAEQVRPLLPGSRTSMAIVTSRSRLTGLSVTSGATLIDLDLLPFPDAVALLRRCVGERRAAAEPAAIARLVELCARLPLALRLCGQHAAARPRRPLSDLVDELLDEGRRLELLSRSGDDSTAVRTVFAWSYRSVSSRHARMFRLLGLHPGPEIGTFAAAALAGLAPREARSLLDDLVDTNLIEASGRDRFQMHDLLRAYARELAETEAVGERHDDQGASVSDAPRDALLRLVGYFTHSAAAATRRLNPNRPAVASLTARSPRYQPSFADYDEALLWCERERGNIVAVTRAAAAAGLYRAAWQLAHIIGPYLHLRGNWSEWIDLHSVGLDAAERRGDRNGRGHMLNGLAIGYAAVRRTGEAINALRVALALFRQDGDQVGESRTQTNLGDTLLGAGRYEEAIEHCQRSFEIYRELGNPWGEGLALGTLGEAYLGLRRYDEAIMIFQEVLFLCRKANHRSGEGKTHIHLGEACLGLRRHDEASEHLEAALVLCGESGDRYNFALALRYLGDTHRALGRIVTARRYWRDAMEIFERRDDPRGEELRRLLIASGEDGLPRPLSA